MAETGVQATHAKALLCLEKPKFVQMAPFLPPCSAGRGWQGTEGLSALALPEVLILDCSSPLSVSSQVLWSKAAGPHCCSLPSCLFSTLMRAVSSMTTVGRGLAPQTGISSPELPQEQLD